jgi:hypothetical protein
LQQNWFSHVSNNFSKASTQCLGWWRACSLFHSHKPCVFTHASKTLGNFVRVSCHC